MNGLSMYECGIPADLPIPLQCLELNHRVARLKPVPLPLAFVPSQTSYVPDELMSSPFPMRVMQVTV